MPVAQPNPQLAAAAHTTHTTWVTYLGPYRPRCARPLPPTSWLMPLQPRHPTPSTKGAPLLPLPPERPSSTGPSAPTPEQRPQRNLNTTYCRNTRSTCSTPSRRRPQRRWPRRWGLVGLGHPPRPLPGAYLLQAVTSTLSSQKGGRLSKAW